MVVPLLLLCFHSIALMAREVAVSAGRCAENDDGKLRRTEATAVSSTSITFVWCTDGVQCWSGSIQAWFPDDTKSVPHGRYTCTGRNFIRSVPLVHATDQAEC